jgi:hypothetical protein
MQLLSSMGLPAQKSPHSNAGFFILAIAGFYASNSSNVQQ